MLQGTLSLIALLVQKYKYWYKITNTDAVAGTARACAPRLARMQYLQFTCFTGTTVRILTQQTSLQVPVRHDTRACEVLSRLRQVLSLGLNCTKVPAPLLVHKVQLPSPDALRARSVLHQYLYFCTSKASKLRRCGPDGTCAEQRPNLCCVSICTFVPAKQVN